MTDDEFRRELGKSKVVAVIRSGTWEDAVKLGTRAASGLGLTLIEVSWTNPDASRALRELSDAVSVLGAGTILTPEQAESALEAGAQFIVAPNFSEAVGRVARDRRVPYVPGVYTANEVAAACSLGFNVLKLFPAATGSPSHLRSLREPFPDVQWVPTGGVTWDSAEAWLRAGAIAVGMGTSLFNVTDASRRIASLRNLNV